MGELRGNDSRQRQLSRQTNRSSEFARAGVQRHGRQSFLWADALAESPSAERARDRLRKGTGFEMATRALGRNLHLSCRATGHGRGARLELSAVIRHSVD